MRRAIFPGTFDPFTIGHYSVVKRALTFMDEVIIRNRYQRKQEYLFPHREKRRNDPESLQRQSLHQSDVL